MSGSVYIFNTFAAQPTYHGYGRTTDEADVTRCGLVMYKDGATKYAATLRRDHADLFAAPCAKCFPEQAA